MGKKSKKTKDVVKHKTKCLGNKKTDDSSASTSSFQKPLKFTAEQLLVKAEEYVDTFQYDLAYKFVQTALQQEPESLRGLELCGTLLLETGDIDGSRECFLHAVNLQPEDGHSKYMYLGQLNTGKEAVDFFLKGIELMKKTISQLEEQNSAAALVDQQDNLTDRDVSSAYCAVAEIFLTDECFDANAETKCHQFIKEAVKVDQQNPEAHHLMASFYLSVNKEEEAWDSLKKGVDLWLPVMQAANQPDAELPDMNVCNLSYPARVNASKLLTELGKYDLACEVLELLLDEDEDVIEVWYMLGWINYLQGEDYKNNARFYLTKAKKLFEKCGCDDEQIVEHTFQLLDELGPESEEDDGYTGESGDDGVDYNSDMDTEITTENGCLTKNNEAVMDL